MIEVSDEKYWKKLNYYNGLLYCQLLDIDGKNDWRMLKDDAERENIKHAKLCKTLATWFISDLAEISAEILTNNSKMVLVIPVRDI